MGVITISRQYGSGGDEIARQLCGRLNYRYLDKQLMSRVASQVAMGEVKISDFSEDSYKARSFLDRWLGLSQPELVAEIRTWSESAIGTRALRVERLDEAEAISLIQAIITEVYRMDNMVILGRGGQMILKDKANVLHVRIEAPFDERVRRVQEIERVTLAEAQEKVANRDKAAYSYIKRFYGVDWADPLLYHLVINTSLCGISASVQLICEAVSALKLASTA
jgi:cytidylate kinase